MADVANISASSGNPGRPRGGRALGGGSGAPDEALVERLADGDAAAIGPLYDRHARLAFTLARRICADDGRAEGVLRDVLVELWRDPGRFDPKRGEFVRWLVSEVHRAAVGALGAESAHRRRELTAGYRAEEWLGGFPDGRLREALAELSAEQRATFVLAYYGGYTQPETAALTGVPERTALARMFRAARRLRRQLLTPSWESGSVGGAR